MWPKFYFVLVLLQLTALSSAFLPTGPGVRTVILSRLESCQIASSSEKKRVRDMPIPKIDC
jgi:hypothetical protein